MNVCGTHAVRDVFLSMFLSVCMCFLKLQCAEPFRPSDCPHISSHHLLDGKCKLQIQKARQSQHKCTLSLVSDSGAHFISWPTLHLSKKLISPHLTLPLTGEPSHAVEAKLFVFNQALIPSESKTFLIMFLCCGAPRLCEKPKGLQIDLQHRSGPFHPPFLLVPLFASCSVLIGCHLTQTLFYEGQLVLCSSQNTIHLWGWSSRKASASIDPNQSIVRFGSISRSVIPAPSTHNKYLMPTEQLIIIAFLLISLFLSFLLAAILEDGRQ